MKKIVLSALAALTISTVASASDVTLYQDENGQVFTTAGEGRTELKSNKETSVFAKADKLKFSGKAYAGYNFREMQDGLKENKDASGDYDGTFSQVNNNGAGSFELRRNYVQVKAYLLEDPKSYFRVTLDATYSSAKQANDEGHANVYVKYAYLYLNEVLPNTGVEFGMVHRPWIDYEEHQGWWMRSISKVFIEAGEAGHLSNSSDLGFNLKTKTEYFTSEVGLFNGEGYHGTNDSEDDDLGDGTSAEWRLTGSFLGNGKKKRKPLEDSYFDASFFGQYNMKNSHNAEDASGVNKGSHNYLFYGLHTVYNMPSFLISVQYVNSDNDLDNAVEWNGKGYSVNGTYRFGEKKQFSVIGRYDRWDNINSKTDATEYKEDNYIYGLAWEQNKNVKWLLSGQTYNRNGDVHNTTTKDWTSGMLTAEVHW